MGPEEMDVWVFDFAEGILGWHSHPLTKHMVLLMTHSI